MNNSPQKRVVDSRRQRVLTEEKRRKGSWQKVLVVILAALVLVIGGTAGWFYWRYQSMLKPIPTPTADGSGSPVDTSPLPEPTQGENVNILLMGVDARPGETTSRSDTIIFLSVNNERAEPGIFILSIPRDSYVEIPGYGMDKVNHSHSYGGIPLLVETVSNLLGRPIHYYAEMNFEGFAKAMEILGGVDFNIEQRMYYPDEGIDLEPGLQHLNGEQCLAFVRYRSYPEGDIARVQQQQLFLSAIIDQHFTLANVLKLPLIFNEVAPYIATNLPLDRSIALGRVLAQMNMNQVQMHLVPGAAIWLNEISYWEVDQAGLEQILDAWDHPELQNTETPTETAPAESGGTGESVVPTEEVPTVDTTPSDVAPGKEYRPTDSSTDAGSAP